MEAFRNCFGGILRHFPGWPPPAPGSWQWELTDRPGLERLLRLYQGQPHYFASEKARRRLPLLEEALELLEKGASDPASALHPRWQALLRAWAPGEQEF